MVNQAAFEQAVVKNSSEQERGIFPSLPDTSTFGVNSPQMAQIRAKKTLNDPKSSDPIVDKTKNCYFLTLNKFLFYKSLS